MANSLRSQKGASNASAGQSDGVAPSTGEPRLDVARALEALGTPERVALAAALAFHKLAASPSGFDQHIVDASQIIEAVWLSLRRKDGKALYEARGWARKYLSDRDADEIFSGVFVMTKRDGTDHLLGRAKFCASQLERVRTIEAKNAETLKSARGSLVPLAKKTTKMPFGLRTTAPFDVQMVGHVMAYETSRVAPWLCSLPRDSKLYEEAKRKIAQRVGAAEKKDAGEILRSTLSAFGLSGKEIANLTAAQRTKSRKSAARRDRNS